MTTQLQTRPLKSFDLYAAVVGDVHVGHPNTPTIHILNNLRRAFPDTPTTGDLDIIFIEGDFFDRQLNLPDPNVYEIKLWITGFLRICKARNIIVRVLEGTPSHDWKQSALFTTINELSQINADVKYVTDLSIEYIDSLDISVLYVPDEWRVRCEDTWNEVVELLARNNLKQVDYAIMHGIFPHQMPKNIHHHLEMHDPARYLSIVKKEIFIGHVHQHTVFDRIFAAGSFDRLTHGEESPKGHLRLRVEKDTRFVEFIENVNAMQYVTIDCSGLDVDAYHRKIASIVPTLPNGSHVRIKAMRGDVAITGISHYQDNYPQYRWTVKEAGKGVDGYTPLLIDTRAMHKTINITSDNISGLLIERLAKSNPEIDQQHAMSLLEEIK
jgi:hypothetical protein